MKKAWIVLISLALLALSIPVFADGPVTKVGVDSIWSATYDLTNNAYAGAATHARLKFDTQVDKNNDLYIELRGDGNSKNWGSTDFLLYNWKLTTDVTGALGMSMPVTIKLTTGYFDTYFTNWTGIASNGWDYYKTGNSGWPAKLVNVGMQASGAYQLDIGAGPVNIHYYNDLVFNNLMLGADGSFAGLGFFVSYGAYNIRTSNAGLGKGDVSIETKYTLPKMGDLNAAVALLFRYGLGDSLFFSSLGASVDYTMFHVGLGASYSSTGPNTYGKTGSALDHAFFEASVAPTANAKVGVNADMDFGQSTSPLTGVDIYGNYKFGAAKVQLGYVVAGADKVSLPLDGDNFGSPANGGPYLDVDISW